MKQWQNIYRGMLVLMMAAILALFIRMDMNERAQSLKLIKDTEPVVHTGNDREVYACGKIAGIYLKTNGILVVDTGTVVNEQGNPEDPAGHLVHAGDYIEQVNGKDVESKEELVNQIRGNGKLPIELTIRRQNKRENVQIHPTLGKDGYYMLGIWVRDDTQGIGTITYVTTDGRFGALGHSINDTDTGGILEVANGNIYPARITSIWKGVKDTPGAICGTIDFSRGAILGDIYENGAAGLYGSSEKLLRRIEGEKMPVANSLQVFSGDAWIRSDISGKLCDYEISIREIQEGDASGKNLVLEVTDPELLALTGGIIQGMSGSPIIQNGKLVGAVTHVLVSDPTKGYGIFIDEMLKE